MTKYSVQQIMPIGTSLTAYTVKATQAEHVELLKSPLSLLIIFLVLIYKLHNTTSIFVNRYFILVYYISILFYMSMQKCTFSDIKVIDFSTLKKKTLHKTLLQLRKNQMTLMQKQQPEVFCQKSSPKNFATSAGKHLHRRLFSVDAGLQTATLLKKSLRQRCFSMSFTQF